MWITVLTILLTHIGDLQKVVVGLKADIEALKTGGINGATIATVAPDVAAQLQTVLDDVTASSGSLGIQSGLGATIMGYLEAGLKDVEAVFEPSAPLAPVTPIVVDAAAPLETPAPGAVNVSDAVTSLAAAKVTAVPPVLLTPAGHPVGLMGVLAAKAKVDAETQAAAVSEGS